MYLVLNNNYQKLRIEYWIISKGISIGIDIDIDIRITIIFQKFNFIKFIIPYFNVFNM